MRHAWLGMKPEGAAPQLRPSALSAVVQSVTMARWAAARMTLPAHTAALA